MQRVRILLLATSALAPMAFGVANANPLGSTVVGGSASVSGEGTSSVTVTQSTEKAIINWNTFNIGGGETTRFVQPGASSVTLNRVTGGLGPSQIYGTVTANGRVFLVNPDGILFGSTATIDTAGFLATTNDIKNEDFMAGRYLFNIPGRLDASIVNLGTITAQSGGFAALVAPGVRNSGTITATLGKVGLASGNGFTLDFYGDKLITLSVGDEVAASVKDVATGQTLDALVKNDGAIKADGGRVELTAAAARQVVDSVINTSGLIEANSIGQQNGMIVLGAATGASKPAGAPQQKVKVSGTLSAAGKTPGTKGGTIQVTGEALAFAGATLDASGDAGGGKVLIGGDVSGGHPAAAVASLPHAGLEGTAIPNATSVTIDAATTIDASAKTSGDGGKVVVWSDGTTTFGGHIFARGGATSGDGGFAEVSGKNVLNFTGLVDLSASNGKTGTLLLDPADYYITGGDEIPPAGASVMSSTDLEKLLGKSNVVIATNNAADPEGQHGDIFVNGAVSWSNSNSLTLTAYRNIEVNSDITNTGGAAVNLRADNTGTGDGTVSFYWGATVNTAGPVSIFYNPGADVNEGSKYNNPTSYSDSVRNGEGPGNLTAYMLVNDVADLQAIQNNLNGNYALGKDIDARATANWEGGFRPIGDEETAFNGRFIGGPATWGAGPHLSSTQTTITGLDINSFDGYIGLFGSIGPEGVVSDVSLANVSVAARPTELGGQVVGALAGLNMGLVQNVAVSGSVDGGSSAMVVGGFVGANVGGIERSNAAANVTAGADSLVGGFVGFNLGSVSIASAKGTVTGGADGWVGGFAGVNAGTVNQTFATGAVSGGSNSFVGGLVGLNLPAFVLEGPSVPSISQSYATGTVTGGTESVVGGLAGVNAGWIDQTYAIGAVTGGAGSATGGLVAVNASTSFPVPGAGPGPINTFDAVNTFDTTGLVTNSYWSTDSTGQLTSAAGTPLTSAQLSAALPTGFSTDVWSINPGTTFPFLTSQVVAGGLNPPPVDPCADPTLCGTQTPPTQQVSFFTFPTDPAPTIPGPLFTLVNNDQPPPGTPPGGSGPGNGPGPGIGRTLSERTISGVPPPGETRFISNEVILQISDEVPRSRLEQLARQLGLTVISSQSFGSAGRTIFRFRMANGSDIRDIIRKLEAQQIVASAQPNYVFRSAQGKQDRLPTRDPGQDPADARNKLTPQDGQPQDKDRQDKDADVTGSLTVGDSAQYVIDKLKLGAVHHVARGDNVTIALIDSEIDTRHPDLKGAVVEQFDAVGGPDKPHVHGTAMAGAIASHHRLLGVAPGVRVLAVRAFSEASTSAEGTSYSILRGLDWAVREGARVINMSFAGPRDPMLERVMKTAHDKGVVLVAAAGNAGPKSPPLYPGADPSVIAVTATDVNDRLFAGANRGRYVAIAAPGVDVLAAAPDGSYQLTTGTSVAAAHVSGVVALLLERNPKLTPEAVRKILTTSAIKLGVKGQNDMFGAGLVSPERALSELSGATSDATGSVRRVTY